MQAPIWVPEAYDPVAQFVPETVPLPEPALFTVNEIFELLNVAVKFVVDVKSN